MKVIAYLLTIVFLFGDSAFAQTKFAAPIMNWAGDAEGGAPYQMPDPRNPSRIIGFEVDIADALAKRMGRTANFIQNQWDGLVPGLERGEYDMLSQAWRSHPKGWRRSIFQRRTITPR